jgi:hypothetical protein
LIILVFTVHIHKIARDKSYVVARDKLYVVARDKLYVIARDKSSFVVARDKSPYVIVWEIEARVLLMLHSVIRNLPSRLFLDSIAFRSASRENCKRRNFACDT